MLKIRTALKYQLRTAKIEEKGNGVKTMKVQ